ncbi:MAG: hypothetical protein E7462_01335 [Ruminococcaceae bacterium]|nr:hypothetical protein [Oscillospiraceae bacterium]
MRLKNGSKVEFKDSTLFSNAGMKIMEYAKTSCIIKIAFAFIIGFLYIVTSNDRVERIIAGFLVMGLGAFLSWLISLLIYGFGKLVYNSDIRTRLAIEEAIEQ